MQFADGLGSDVTFGDPWGIAIDSMQNIIYVADNYYSALRKINISTSDNYVTTIYNDTLIYDIAIDSSNQNLYLANGVFVLQFSLIDYLLTIFAGSGNFIC